MNKPNKLPIWPPVTRFAPSPTGAMHLGHALAAITAFDAAKSHNEGRFLLRIEDIDVGRTKPEFESAIIDDLSWLGLSWESPIIRQSEQMDKYAKALEQLQDMGLLYPCFCTRKDIQKEIDASPSAPHLVSNGPDGPLYPGTCKTISSGEREENIKSGKPYALRLDMKRAVAVAKKMTKETAGEIKWMDIEKGEITARPEIFGDVVLARKDIPTSYHLAVTIDDHNQGVTLITRGEDLFPATHIHRLIQVLLSLNTPTYHHHPLVMTESGERMSKRHKSMTLKSLRESGHSLEDIRKMLDI